MSSININKDVSDYFLGDARDFLRRYQLLKGESTHAGIRSKLLLELLFSIECALKSLIFLESNEDEIDTYKRARKAGHSLEKLCENLSPAGQAAYKDSVKTNIEKYAVSIRYLMESSIRFSDQYGVLGTDYYQTIANPQWFDQVYIEISKFVDYVANLTPIVLTTMNFNDINVGEIADKQQRLRSLIGIMN